MQPTRRSESSGAEGSAAAAAGTVRKAPGEVRSIQYLRGLAAFGVLIFHAMERAGGGFGTGAAGVDIFFVISGFIMWVVTCRKTPSPKQFLLRRVERIVPLYWLVTLGTAAIAILIPPAFPNMRATAAHVIQSLLFVPHHDNTGAVAPLIVPGWTLNYEMFFYLLFAVGLLASARLRPWLVSGALLALVALRPLGDTTNAVWATYTNPILLEFGAGVWLGKAWSENRLPGRRAGWAMLVAGALAFAATNITYIDVEPARIFWWGVPAFLMVAGAVSIERHGPVASWPPLRALGDASYSVYLVHGLAISAAFRLLQMAGLASPAIILPTAIVAGLIGGFAAYHLLEKPMMRFFKTGMAAHRPKDAPVLAAGVAPAPKA